MKASSSATTTTTTTTATKTSSSSKEIAQKLKSLLKELPEERADAARLDELRRFFAQLIQTGEFSFGKQQQQQRDSTTATSSSNSSSNSNSNNQSAKMVQKWQNFLRQKHEIFVAQLVTRIVEEGRRTAMRTLLGVVATTPQTHILPSTKSYYSTVDPQLIYLWLKATAAATSISLQDKTVKLLFESELEQCDVQYYVMVAIQRWAKEQYQEYQDEQTMEKDVDESESTRSLQAERMLHILMMLPIHKSQEDIDNNTKLLFPLAKHMQDIQEQHKSHDYDTGKQDHDDTSSSRSGSDSDASNSSEDTSGEEESEDEEEERPVKRQKREKNIQNKGFIFQRFKGHMRALSKAWTAMLRLPFLPSAALKRALPYVSQHVLTRVGQPLYFADFFMQAYQYKKGQTQQQHSSSSSRVISILALDGLFYLMTVKGLEYPMYYQQLYQLITPSLFYMKNRTRFFTLLSKSLLRNEMLPAHLVAAFLKRILRSALQAPPSGALFCLALCSNLLREHRACSILIHRDDSDNGNGGFQDKYNADTDDLVKANALSSSLWELNALEQHYYAPVATLAHSVGREDERTTPMYNLEEFASHTYTSIFEQEKNKKYKRKNGSSSCPLAFQTPSGLFSSKDIFAGILDFPTQCKEK